MHFSTKTAGKTNQTEKVKQTNSFKKFVKTETVLKELNLPELLTEKDNQGVLHHKCFLNLSG